MTTQTLPRRPADEPELLGDLVTEAAGDVLGPGRTRTVVLAMSKDENPKATVYVRPERTGAPSLVVKVAMTPGASRAVLREAAALRRLAQLDPGRVNGTVPACLDVRSDAGRAVLVMSACGGTPLSTAYHRWRHTATATRVHADFAAAANWLTELGRLPGASPSARSSDKKCPLDGEERGQSLDGEGWGQSLDGEGHRAGAEDWAEQLRRRWPHDELAEQVASGVAGRLDRLEATGAQTPQGIVHGDFWCGNLLHEHGTVTGVVDWEHCRDGGDPVRDRARFALAYALYLDRHTPTGRRVPGHPGLVAGPWGEPVRHVLRGTGWFPQIVAGFVGDGLTATGRDPQAWRDALVVGLAEVAVLSDHADFARQHLELTGEALTWLS